MFEKYTEKARRAIFFSRWEAGEYGATVIDSEHLLLGLLREDEAIMERISSLRESLRLTRKYIEQNTTTRTKIQESVDMPLSKGYQVILLHAANEANQLNSEYIDTKHLLLGILREEGSSAAKILMETGLTYSTALEKIL